MGEPPTTAGKPPTLAFLLLAAFLLPILAHGAEPVPERSSPKTESSVVYECRRTADDSVKIGGELNEEAWNLAAPITDFQTAGPKPETATFHSVARLLWSRKRLFLAFGCSADTILDIGTNRDEDIWYGETAELYLCPPGSETKYYEIDFNPQNVIYDSLVHTSKYAEQAKPYKKWARVYNAKIESVRRIVKDKDGKVTGWILEAAIPFDDLREADHVPPRAGDAWLFNVCHIAQVNEKEFEYSAWVPTPADFHKPWKFPSLRFGEEKGAAAP